MRRTGRPQAITALLLASAAALAGCAREGDYERTPPSRYAGTWQNRNGRELPDDRQAPFRGRFARDVSLPPDARATGYHHGPYTLWVSPSDADRHVYVQGPDGVERWARPAQRIGCA